MSVHLADLIARRDHHIGHRIIPAGETFARVQFRSEEDRKFFRNHLRWSAFEIRDVPVDEAAIAAGADKVLVAQVMGDLQAIQADNKALTAELQRAKVIMTAQAAKLGEIAGTVGVVDQPEPVTFAVAENLADFPPTAEFATILAGIGLMTVRDLAATDYRALKHLPKIGSLIAKRLVAAAVAAVGDLPPAADPEPEATEEATDGGDQPAGSSDDDVVVVEADDGAEDDQPAAEASEVPAASDEAADTPVDPPADQTPTPPAAAPKGKDRKRK